MKPAVLAAVCLFFSFADMAVGAPRGWDASQAASEAQRDFLAHRVQFYWHGTRGSYPVGVAPKHLALARTFPRRDAGIGCIVDDWALRARQKRFAERYNAKMLSFVLKSR